MPPFLLSPLVKWSLIAAGGAMVVHWVVKETRRINEELERARRAARVSDRGTMLLPCLVVGVAVSVQNPVKVSGLTPYRAADTVPFDSRA